MKPYRQRRLGEVGEGVWAIERTQPLTQLSLGSKLPSFRNPLPLERETTPQSSKNPQRGELRRGTVSAAPP